MPEFIIAATVVFGFLTVIWNSSDWFNILLRLVFLGMLAWGIVRIAIIFSS